MTIIYNLYCCTSKLCVMWRIFSRTLSPSLLPWKQCSLEQVDLHLAMTCSDFLWLSLSPLVRGRLFSPLLGTMPSITNLSKPLFLLMWPKHLIWLWVQKVGTYPLCWIREIKSHAVTADRYCWTTYISREERKRSKVARALTKSSLGLLALLGHPSMIISFGVRNLWLG